MLDFGFYNMDCMEGMKEFPDKYFDLAIVDPPYGKKVGQGSYMHNTISGGWLNVIHTIWLYGNKIDRQKTILMN